MRWPVSFFVLVLLVTCVHAATHTQFTAFSAPEDFSVENNVVSVTDDAIYQIGWYSVNGAAWQSFILQGDNYGDSASWLTGGVSASLPSLGSGEHYVIIYSCTDTGSWDCHGNTANPAGFWQLQVINIAPNGLEIADYYVAPDGDDYGLGTIDDPWRTWGKAFQTAQAGDLVYFRNGVYYSAADNLGGERDFNSGTPDAPIRFFNYPGETPILDCSLRQPNEGGYNAGVRLWHVSNIHMKGLTVRNVFQVNIDVNAVGIALWDVANITLEEMVVHNVDGEANTVSDYYDTVEYINCDAYNMNDALRTNLPPLAGTPGQNGAGFHQSLYSDTPGAEDARLIYRGCRAWNFSDNGFAGTSVGYVEYDNCWAFDGGMLYGDGCGFKYASVYGDDNDLDHARVVKNCIGTMNGAYGFSPNNRGDVPLNGHYYNNFAYHNGYKGEETGYGFFILNYLYDIPKPNEMYSNNIAYDNERGEVYEGDNYIHEYNSWDQSVTLSDDDFMSLDWTQLMRPRKADGSLPDITFGTLREGSDLIDAGTNVGLPYQGSAPDLGFSESSYSAPDTSIHYIDTSGSDSTGDGSLGNPWHSLAHACSQVTTFGDTIHVNAGTFNEDTQCTLAVGVTIEGEGDTSIISSTLSSQWQPTILLHSTSEGTNGDQSISHIMMDGNDVAWQAIMSNARSNVHIHDCTFVDFFHAGVSMDGKVITSSVPPTMYATGNKFYNNYLDNCADFTPSTGYGEFMFGGQEGIEIFNNTMISNSRAYHRNGYNIKYSYGGWSKGYKIYNNHLTMANEGAADPFYDFSLELWHTQGGAEIYNNTMTGGIDFGGGITMLCLEKGDYDYGAWVHDNVIGPDAMVIGRTGIYLERNTEYAIIERNIIKNCYNGITMTPSSGETTQHHIFRNNIFNNIGFYAIRYTYGSNPGANVHHLDFYNNVIYMDPAGGLVGIGIPTLGTTSNINIINNIIQGASYSAILGHGTGGQTLDTLNIQNNIFYDNAFSNLPRFESLTPTNYVNSGNLIEDPLFINAGLDFHLTEGSPAVDAGTTVGLSFDGVAPDIGAFESSYTAPTCSDGIRNQDETDVDCGGSCAACVVIPPPEGALIADHTSIDVFDDIPACWIEQAKDDFRISYAHTSHGSQIVSGINMFDTQGNIAESAVACSAYSGEPGLYDYCENYASGTTPAGVLSFWDFYANIGDYMYPGAASDIGHAGSTLFATSTRTHLAGLGADRNVIMWSWCGGVSDNTFAGIDAYLNAMNQLEIDYPNVRFIYMTGHLDGTGVAALRDGTNPNARMANQIIREYAITNEKILFDFEDVESWDPNGVYYVDETDACGWCADWCNPTMFDCATTAPADWGCGCAHSRCYNCYQKGKAFWWMMARMAGWNGLAEGAGANACT